MSHIFLSTLLGICLLILGYATLVVFPIYIGRHITGDPDRVAGWGVGIWAMGVAGIGLLIAFAIGNFFLSLFV